MSGHRYLFKVGPRGSRRALQPPADRQPPALAGRLLIAGGRPYPFIYGKLPKTETPTARLDLVAGDMVRIKSKEEIFATLGSPDRIRGLSFDTEMLEYCGRTAQVRGRVERLIDEDTGEDDPDQVGLHHP